MTVQTFSDASEQKPIRVPSRYWWLKRIVLGAVLMLVGLAGLRWWWGFEAHRRLQAEIARYRAMGQPVLPEDFVREPIPNEENGAYWLMKAADELDTSMFAANWDWKPTTWSFSFCETVLKANTRALELVARAKECEHAEWGLPVIVHDPNNPAAGQTAVVVARTQRELFRLFPIGFEHHMRKNEPLKAIDRFEDGLHHTRLMMESDDGLLWFVMLGNQYSQVASLSDHGLDFLAALGGESTLSERPLRAQLLKIQRLLLEGGSTAATTRRRLMIDRTQWLAEISDPIFVKQASRWGATPTEQFVLDVQEWILRPEFVLTIAADVSAWDGALKAAESIGSGGFITKPRAVWDISVNTAAWPMQRSLVKKTAGERILEMVRRNLAQRRTAALAIALWIYEADHGQSPSDIQWLVPVYIPEIPLDPFAGDPDVRLWLVNDRWGPRITNTIDQDDRLDSRVFWLYGRPLMIQAIMEWEPELTDEETLDNKDDAVSDEGQADEKEDSHDEPE